VPQAFRKDHDNAVVSDGVVVVVTAVVVIVVCAHSASARRPQRRVAHVANCEDVVVEADDELLVLLRPLHRPRLGVCQAKVGTLPVDPGADPGHRPLHPARASNRSRRLESAIAWQARAEEQGVYYSIEGSGAVAK
jgi:hypothetical protein